MSERIPFDRLLEITAHAESRNRDYYPDGRPVVSPKGARYQMQVMPATARDPGYGIRPARDNSPEEYNRVGREYLAAMARKYGSMDKAWAAYNGGPGRLDRVGSVGNMPRETRDYVANNMKALGARAKPMEPKPMDDEDELDAEGSTYTPSGGGLAALSRPSRLGVSEDLIGLQKDIISSQERQRATRQQQLAAATKLLEERRLGPSRTEQLLQLSAAFLQPRQYKGFGSTMANVLPVLAQQAAQKRTGESSRAEDLMKLQHTYQNADMEGENASLKARSDLLKLAQGAEKPRYTSNSVTGETFDRYTGYAKPGAAHIGALLANPDRAAEFDQKFGPGAAEEALATFGGR